jgi:Lar family restriction alleviation protein
MEKPAIALLPCPFCGGEAELGNLVDEDDYFVQCKDCEVQQIANYKPRVAVRRWNQRNFPVPERRESRTAPENGN